MSATSLSVFSLRFHVYTFASPSQNASQYFVTPYISRIVFIYWNVYIGDWVCAAGETDKGARVRLARVWAHAHSYWYGLWGGALPAVVSWYVSVCPFVYVTMYACIHVFMCICMYVCMCVRSMYLFINYGLAKSWGTRRKLQYACSGCAVIAPSKVRQCSRQQGVCLI